MAKATQLKVEYRDPGRLKPYANNARTHGPEQVAKIVASIKEFGWTKPIIVDERDMVLAGHGALEAAKVMELAKVPVIVKAGLTRAQKRAYILADNKIGEDSGWDPKLLRFELTDLGKIGLNLDLTGFKPVEVKALLNPDPPAGRKPGQSKIVHECPNCGHKWQG